MTLGLVVPEVCAQCGVALAPKARGKPPVWCSRRCAKGDEREYREARVEGFRAVGA